MDKLIKWLVALVAVMALGLSGLFLYQYAGLKYYIKAVSYIKAMPTTEEKDKAWSSLVETPSDKYYRGIYGGDYLGRIWVWGKSGLRSFAVSQKTAYSFFDGCSDEVVGSDSHMGSDQQMFGKFSTFDKEQWQKTVNVGDIALVMVASESGKVKAGTMEEIIDYNFWFFRQKEQKIECAK
jgi:hypothetical protein